MALGIPTLRKLAIALSLCRSLRPQPRRLRHVNRGLALTLLNRDQVLPVRHIPFVARLLGNAQEFLLRRVPLLPDHDVRDLGGDPVSDIAVIRHLIQAGRIQPDLASDLVRRGEYVHRWQGREFASKLSRRVAGPYFVGDALLCGLVISWKVAAPELFAERHVEGVNEQRSGQCPSGGPCAETGPAGPAHGTQACPRRPAGRKAGRDPCRQSGGQPSGSRRRCVPQLCRQLWYQHLDQARFDGGGGGTNPSRQPCRCCRGTTHRRKLLHGRLPGHFDIRCLFSGRRSGWSTSEQSLNRWPAHRPADGICRSYPTDPPPQPPPPPPPPPPP